MKKITMKNNILSLFTDYYNLDKDQYWPVFHFIGEKKLPSTGEYVFLSHRGPARVTDLFQEGLLDRRTVKSRTGAYYYEYKLKAEK